MISIQGLPKNWYHGTHAINFMSILDSGIDFSKSRTEIDFGPGFYLTSNYEQAAIQAKRVTNKYNKQQEIKFKYDGVSSLYAEPIVLQYQIDRETLSELDGALIFQGTTQDWAAFILGNRSTNTEAHYFHNRDAKFDFVYGPLADGFTIPRLILDYEEGIITMEQFWEEISNYKFPENNQLSIHTDKAKECLTLKGVTPVAIPKFRINN